MPFFDKKTNRTFSAGTRFVRSNQQKNKKTISVWILNPKLDFFDIVQIPKNICLTETPKSEQAKRKAFLKILRQWASEKNGIIPYVWGGCSFTRNYKKSEIGSRQMKLKNGKIIPVYFVKNQNGPASGFDCTGVVVRAAQIIGLPYFFKNSSTAFKNLQKIHCYENIKPGDLLYFSGHIMIVSDVKNNKIIEARTHWQGFGKLHETSLEKVFKGIKDYKQLCNVCKTKSPLDRLNNDGEIEETKKGARFLKLPF